MKFWTSSNLHPEVPLQISLAHTETTSPSRDTYSSGSSGDESSSVRSGSASLPTSDHTSLSVEHVASSNYDQALIDYAVHMTKNQAASSIQPKVNTALRKALLSGYIPRNIIGRTQRSSEMLLSKAILGIERHTNTSHKLKAAKELLRVGQDGLPLSKALSSMLIEELQTDRHPQYRRSVVAKLPMAEADIVDRLGTLLTGHPNFAQAFSTRLNAVHAAGALDLSAASVRELLAKARDASGPVTMQ